MITKLGVKDCKFSKKFKPKCVSGDSKQLTFFSALPFPLKKNLKLTKSLPIFKNVQQNNCSTMCIYFGAWVIYSGCLIVLLDETKELSLLSLSLGLDGGALYSRGQGPVQ